MAINSVLDPETIVGQQNNNPLSMQRLVSGDEPFGSSILNTAASNVNGLQVTGVQPSAPAIGDIVSTISQNINNNFDTQIQKIYQTVDGNLNNSLNNFSKDYGDRISQLNQSAPSGIPDNFSESYKSALGFIQYFGDKKNADSLKNSLDTLQNSFTESFSASKSIRGTISNMVNQLTNLPTAKPGGGGGINVDVDIPGSDIKRGTPKSLTQVLGSPVSGGSIGASGLSGSDTSGENTIGKGAVNALSDTKSSIELASPISESKITDDMVNKFSSIVDRFSNAIDSLIQGASGDEKPKDGISSQSSTPSSGKQPETPSPPGSPGVAVSSAPGDEKLAAFVASLEASSPENAADALQVMLNRTASGYSEEGLAGVISSRDQFSPISAAIYGKSADKRAERIYGPLAPKLGNTPEERFKKLQEIASGPNGLNDLEKLFGHGSASVAATILNDPKYLESSRQNIKGSLNFYGDTKKLNSSDIQVRPGGNYFYNNTGKLGYLGTQPTENVASRQRILTNPQQQVAAAPTQSQVQSNIATKVSQTPRQTQQPIFMPINLSGAGEQQQQQPSGGGMVTPPPSSPGGGPTVPILPSSNPENFLVLYSRMVYNIVDG